MTMAKQHLKVPPFLAILHIAIRISLANKAPITDCDEVYNYWEPLHFLHYGYGMQTWEYAPTFALRTYAYLLPISFISRAYEIILNVCPASILSLLSKAFSPTTVATAVDTFTIHKPLQFHLLRATFAFLTSISELRLIHALPSNLSIPTWIILLSSTGMFHTAPAYLPSTTVMICFMHSIVEQMGGKMDRAIVWGLISCLMTGWPFCAVLFIPLGFKAAYLSYVNNGKGGNSIASVMKLLLRVVGYSIMIQTVVSSVDYIYYGKILSPTWNIFVYNTGWGGDGINRDELYGVEDVSYYVKNLILNWNGVAVMGVLALPLLVLKHLVSSRTVASKDECNIERLAVILLPAYLWMAIVFSRPHKEERFLFPIYPLLAIGAAIVLNQAIDATGICSIVEKFIHRDTTTIKMYTTMVILLPFVLLSISRSVLLSDGYTAPLKLYTELHHIIINTEANSLSSHRKGPILICTGGEWYRFPSSYHLPDKTRLAYLKSSFDGQLPQPFTEFGSRNESLEHQGRFNDLNEEEMDRYINISDCSYVIDLVHDNSSDESSEVFRYMKEDDHKWQMVSSFDFLDVERTPSLHRILYLPFVRGASYKQYAIFQRINQH
jgi:alpha-1,2-mannosyltransferase